MSFQQGLSGLFAASANLDAIGNNVANASTVANETVPADSDAFIDRNVGSDDGAFSDSSGPVTGSLSGPRVAGTHRGTPNDGERKDTDSGLKDHSI